MKRFSLKHVLAVCFIFLLCCFNSGCSDKKTVFSSDADVASSNITTAATMFEVDRRIVFYDAIQGVYLLSIEGKCVLETGAKDLAVTCKTGAKSYKKHFLGLSDNVTYFAEQMDGVEADVYHYRVIFRPSAIIPNIDLATGK